MRKYFFVIPAIFVALLVVGAGKAYCIGRIDKTISYGLMSIIMTLGYLGYEIASVLEKILAKLEEEKNHH